MAAGLLYAVFPSLNKVSDGHVTTQIGNAIKVNLPKKVQENDQWKKQFSANCICIGGINIISLHALITLFQACARTGHATGACIDSYLNPMNILKRLPCAHALHGNKELHMKVVLPSIEMIGSENQAAVQRLIKEMFGIPSIPEFQEGGALQEVLGTYAASLILHHPQLLIDCCNANRVSSVLIKNAEDAKITDAQYPLFPPDLALLEWSKRIKDKYEKAHELAILEARGDTGSLELSLLSQVAKDMNTIKEQYMDMASELALSKASCTYLGQQLQQTRWELQQTQDQLEQQRSVNEELKRILKTPPAAAAYETRERYARMEGMEDLRVSGGIVNAELALTPSLVPNAPAQAGPQVAAIRPIAIAPRVTAIQPIAAAPQVVATVTQIATAPNGLSSGQAYASQAFLPRRDSTMSLRNSDHSNHVSKSTGDKGKALADTILYMAEVNVFHPGRRLDAASIPKDFSNPSKLKHCLTVADFAGNRDDIAILQTHNKDRSTLLDAASRIETAVIEKVFEFEGTTAAIAKAAPGRTPGSTITGLAKRIMAYRHKIKAARGLHAKQKTEDVPLVEYSELMQIQRERDAPVGTPPIVRAFRGPN